MVETVGYRDGAVELIDQTVLPGEVLILRITDLDTLCEAIRSLRVRGAPAIGVAAAYAFRMQADAWVQSGATGTAALREHLHAAGRTLGATRPTARNLFMAIERLLRVVDAPHADAPALVRAVA